MKLFNKSKETFLAYELKVADNFFSRFMGLMGKKELSHGAGLLISPCNSIHMFFMRIPLDIVFIDKNNTVISIIIGIKPWRVSSFVKNAVSTIELPVGTIAASHTSIGDVLALFDTDFLDDKV
ncbi:MAG: DUF192 domain-containing protein [Bacillota bacterium]|nr:DUF192 domain-containing protein [Bacillota bacterium]